MPNKYYDAGHARADKVRDLFDLIAPRYDRVNDLQSFGLHRFWKTEVIRCSGLTPGQVGIDLCCGTGDLTFAMAQKEGLAIGIDFSPGMLRMTKARAVGLRSVQLPLFACGDSLKLPVQSNSADVVTMAYGARNLADLNLGFKEAIRILKPGGVFVVLDFAKPEWQPWRLLYLAYLRLVVPLFGLIFTGERATYSYILESLNTYPPPAQITELLKKAGCEEVVCRKFVGGAMTLHRARKSA